MKIIVNFQLPSCILFCRERDSIEMVAWHIHVKSGWVSLELDLQVEQSSFENTLDSGVT